MLLKMKDQDSRYHFSFVSSNPHSSHSIQPSCPYTVKTRSFSFSRRVPRSTVLLLLFLTHFDPLSLRRDFSENEERTPSYYSIVQAVRVSSSGQGSGGFSLLPVIPFSLLQQNAFTDNSIEKSHLTNPTDNHNEEEEEEKKKENSHPFLPSFLQVTLRESDEAGGGDDEEGDAPGKAGEDEGSEEKSEEPAEGAAGGGEESKEEEEKPSGEEGGGEASKEEEGGGGTKEEEPSPKKSGEQAEGGGGGKYKIQFNFEPDVLLPGDIRDHVKKGAVDSDGLKWYQIDSDTPLKVLKVEGQDKFLHAVRVTEKK